MELGSFGLTIPEGHERTDGYVVMQHAQQYCIKVTNKGYLQCDAVVSLDGDEVGTYRLSPGQEWAIEHPTDSQQRFTFYASGTAEASAVGEAVLSKQEKGLVQVTFYPEQEFEMPKTLGGEPLGATRGGITRGAPKGLSMGLGAGVSGLSGHSSAQYGKANRIIRDEDAAVTITLRLVTEDNTPKPPSMRKQRMANVVPPAVA
jgi:hypothetical protein